MSPPLGSSGFQHHAWLRPGREGGSLRWQRPAAGAEALEPGWRPSRSTAPSTSTRESTLVNSPVQDRPARPAFEPASVRGDFPMLGATVNGKRLVYLDNAASTQKP